MMDERPIGVFDSGVGGLTVLSEIANELAGEQLIYFGDTARSPYGPKSRRTVLLYSRQISRFLLEFDVKLIVVACNTATALTLPDLQQELGIPVLGVIDPAVQSFCERGYQGKLGIIGTRSTIKSEAYLEALQHSGFRGPVFQKACPLFVSLVEEGWADKNISRLVAHEYLDELVREDVGTLILGCTHYPLLKNMLLQEFPGIDLIDGSIETAKQVRSFLEQNNRLSSQSKGSVHIYISDLTDYFQTLEKLFFGGEITSIQDVRLSEDCEEQLEIRG